MTDSQAGTGPDGYMVRWSEHDHGRLLVWRAVVQTSGTYTDAGNEFWGLAFDQTQAGRLSSTLIGPSKQPRDLEVVAGNVSWGVEFPAHITVEGVAKSSLVNQMVPLAVIDGRVEISGMRFLIPEYDDMESLVDCLFKREVLVANTSVGNQLTESPERDVSSYSERQNRRLVTRTTGLSPNQISQLQRARVAYQAIRSGRSLAEAADEAGYADQAHMTRALRAISGLTPARLLHASCDPFSSRPDR